jgi:pseudouridine-5'-phosphate glycosidase
MIGGWLSFGREVQEARDAGRPIVALESTLIAHGLPWPTNLETARDAEQAVRDAGAAPATIAVWEGVPTIGLDAERLEHLARYRGAIKASRRDLAPAIAQKRTAATTVAATMVLAQAAGVSVFATGGIGGAHRDPRQPFDISADLAELARTPVLVVCAGAKNILDLPRTLEILETLSVPVVGYQTDRFPAFYVRESGLSTSARVESPAEAARLFDVNRATGAGGVVLAQPPSDDVALEPLEFDRALCQAEKEAADQAVHGAALTPFLLARLAELTAGRSLTVNRSLIVANARLAAQVAVELERR